MKKLLLALTLTTLTLLCVGLPKKVLSCHYSYLTLNSGPTSIGGGLYSSDVTVCIGQKQNFGATNNFTLCFDVPVSSASGANFPTVSNTYNICGGPCGAATPVTATATGTISGNCITYTTISSTPSGYPLVPDRYDGGAGAAGNSNSFCFTITIVTNGYPTTLTLGGGVEADPGVSGDDGIHLMCQDGNVDPPMIITFPIQLPIDLLYFDGGKYSGYNLLEWVSSSETNNDHYIIQTSSDGIVWITLDMIPGAGNTTTPTLYEYKHEKPLDTINLYSLIQTDYNGLYENLGIIAIDNRIKSKVIRGKYDYMGQPIKPNHIGLVIILYMDGTTKKYMSF